MPGAVPLVPSRLRGGGSTVALDRSTGAITLTPASGQGVTHAGGRLNLQTTGVANWSGSNYGAVVLVKDGPVSHHPAIGLFDVSSTNPVAIVNRSGNLCLAVMPAITDSTTAPSEWFILAQNGLITLPGPTEYTGGVGPILTDSILKQSIGGADPLTLPFAVGTQTVKLCTGGIYADNGVGMGGGAIYHMSTWARNSGTRPVVALFCQGETTGSGEAWGINPVGLCNSATGTSISVEVDLVNLVNGGGCWGVVTGSAGFFPCQNHFQMQSNMSPSTPLDGIMLESSERNPLTRYVMNTHGSFRPLGGINLGAAEFGSFAMRLPLTAPTILNTGVGVVRVVTTGDGYATGCATVTVGISGGGGSGAIIEPYVAGGGVTTAAIGFIAATGTSYTGSPTLTVTKAGTAATATATVVAGAVTALAVATAGDSYKVSSTFAVTFTGGSGTGCTANATTNAAGQVTGFAVTAGGTGYTNGNTLTADLASKATMVAAVGYVSGTCVTNPGAGYGSTPVATFSGGLTAGTAATVTATTVVSGVITVMTLAGGGTGHMASSSFPVYFTGGTGTGAKAWVTTNGSGVVTAVAMTSGGTGYTAGNTLTIAPAVSATCNMLNGHLITLTLGDVGGGLLTVPTIAITGGGSPTTTATAIVARGGVGIGVDPAAPIHIADDGNQWGAVFNGTTYGTSIIIGPGNQLLGLANTIGMFDFTNSNPWAMANVGGDWQLLNMPALGNTTTAPTLRASVSSTGVMVSVIATYNNREWSWVPVVGATTITSSGIAAPTANGTVTNVQDAVGDWINHTSSTLAGVNGWTPTAFTGMQLRWNPVLTMVVEFPAAGDFNANARFWAGWSSAALTGGDFTGASTTSILAFRCSTGPPDSNVLKVVVNAGGGSTTPTAVSTGVTFAAGVKYILRIDASNPASVKVYVNGALTNTITTNLPGTSVALGCTVALTNITATAHTLRVGQAVAQYMAA